MPLQSLAHMAKILCAVVIGVCLCVSSAHEVCVGETCEGSGDGEVSSLVQIVRTDDTCLKITCAGAYDACKFANSCCQRAEWCKQHAQPGCTGKWCNDPAKLQAMCTQTAQDHYNAFQAYDSVALANTYWGDAYQQYGPGNPPTVGKAALLAFNVGFFGSQCNATTCCESSNFTLVASCPEGKPCFSLLQWTAVSTYFKWLTNTLTQIYQIKDETCLISLETGTNSNDCSGDSSSPCISCP